MRSSILNSGVVGNIEMNAQKQIRKDIMERWERLHLLEGLQGHVKETVATLYESQAKHMIYEATDANNSGSFETVVFPLIRRIFSKLLANDIVSVQALNLPVGRLFFIRPITSERQWDFDPNVDEDFYTDGRTGKHVGLMGYKRQNRNYREGSEAQGNEYVNRYYQPDEVVQPDVAAGLPKVTSYMKKSLYDLFYNDRLFDNSKGKAVIRVTDDFEPVILDADGDMNPATLADYPVSADGSLRTVMIRVSGFSTINHGKLTGPDGNEMDSESFTASMKVIATENIGDPDDKKFSTFAKGEELQFRAVSQRYGDSIVNGGGNMYIEIDLIKPAKTEGIRGFDGYVGIDPDALADKELKDVIKIAWAQYDSLELETEIGEVSFQLTSVTVSVEERKLRATWSPELAQDVSAFHSIDAEAELTAILSEQIAAEVDREILRDIRKLAPWKLRWDYNGWQRIPTPSTVYTQKDWNQTLMTKINQLSAQIHKSTLRGGANFIVCSTEISAVFNDLEYFHVTDAGAEENQYNMGIEKVGSIQGRYNVIVDPYAPHWSLIMGHHGTSLLDTGYIYAPYIPMSLTPVMYNVANMAPVRGIVTRYAKKMVNNKYFAAIVVDGLQHFNINELR